MSESFSAFVKHGKQLATEKKIQWDLSLNDKGVAGEGWNLTEFTGAMPPNVYLRDFGADPSVIKCINARRADQRRPLLSDFVLSGHWQDLLKSVTSVQLFFHRNTPKHVASNLIRPLRILATCAGQLEPWQLTSDVVQEAFSIAKEMQACGKLADLILGVTKTIIDANHLSEYCPLYSAVSANRLVVENTRRSKLVKSKEEILDGLKKRKQSQKLPEKRAFWELIRIIFTEKPQSFSDAMRFSVLKLMVICGFRVGEDTRLPVDWKRFGEYYDTNGVPAGELGGFSRSLKLRHFPEKQQNDTGDSTILIEDFQFIPDGFADIVIDTLDEVVRITTPLRDTLRLQCETQRLLPWYDPMDVVSAPELYTRLTGNIFWLDIPDDIRNKFTAAYKNGFNADTLNEISRFQLEYYRDEKSPSKLNFSMYMFYNRMFKKAGHPAPRMANGEKYKKKRMAWGDIYFQVDEVEKYFSESVATKVSDMTPFKLMDGEIQPWEFLFLLPKRALAEERDGGIIDISSCCSIGMADSSLITLAIGNSLGFKSLFERYGETEDDRKLSIKSHSLRHLQTTELFRLGVTDSIIAKRFNRRSIDQNAVYDHRSLDEKLDSIDLPIEAEAIMGSKASTVAKMIATGKIRGPIVSRYKSIQKNEGDETAFSYLKVEADGFHKTPWGICINSFTVDPCPKNLECFAGCRNLVATDLPEDRRSLQDLQKKMDVAYYEATSRPSKAIGRKNQIAHAKARVDAIQLLLDTPAGERVFPDGPDFSLPTTQKSVLDD